LSFNIVNLTCDPPAQKAGKPFTLTVQLEKEQHDDVTVLLEKQRIVLIGGQTPELRPTGPDYFVTGFDPLPIKVTAASRTGTSDPIEVKKIPSPDTGDPKIAFPERLLFTAFNDAPAQMRGFFVVVVPILAPDGPTPTQ
jgi:hypothetical protein